VVGKSCPTISELLSLNGLPDGIKQEYRTFDIPKPVLVQIVRVGPPEEQLRFWSEYKKGDVKTVREAKKRKAGEYVMTAKQLPKPKKLFHTNHKASVIVQSETSRLTQEQIRWALREALDQVEKPAQ